MKKQVMGAALAVCMLTALVPTTGLAADAAQTGVTVAGQVLTDGMGWNNDGTTTKSGSKNNNVYLKDNVLYVSDAEIESETTAISAETTEDLTIVLSGENYIDVEKSGVWQSAISVNDDEDAENVGDVTICGDGYLAVDSSCVGISAKYLTIRDAEMDLSCHQICILAKGALTLNGEAYVSAYGEYHGVGAGDVQITGNAALGIEATEQSCLSCNSLKLTSNALLYAENTRGESGSGISCSGDVTSDGYLFVSSGFDALNGQGNVTITGGVAELYVSMSENPAFRLYAGSEDQETPKVTTTGMYVEAGISSLDAAPVTNFDNTYGQYSYAAIAEDSSLLEWENTFEDVSTSAWYYDYVKYINSHDLMVGVSDTKFSPNGKMTRAQAVQILYNMRSVYWKQYGVGGYVLGEVQIPFTDVKSTDWFMKAVVWAERTNIVAGVGNNRFAPNQNVTREQFAQILYSYAGKLGYDTSARGSLSGFSDGAKVSGWAKTAMQWAVGSGLMHGTNQGALQPKATLTRAQAAVMIRGFIDGTLHTNRTTSAS